MYRSGEGLVRVVSIPDNFGPRHFVDGKPPFKRVFGSNSFGLGPSEALLRTDTRLVAFDWAGCGAADHLIAFSADNANVMRPPSGLARAMSAVYSGPLGGWHVQPGDALVAVDWALVGAYDHLVAYRPGAAWVMVLRRRRGCALALPNDRYRRCNGDCADTRQILVTPVAEKKGYKAHY
eukprot:Selendium_serpulae@DN4658_c0_g1_i1.p2